MLKNYFVKNKNGFTIVELSIVIVVIGILASLIVVGGGSYLDRAAKSKIQNSLVAAASEMKKAHNRQGTYPESLPAAVKPLSDVQLTLIYGGNYFCIQGTAAAVGNVYYMANNTNAPQSGACPQEPTDPEPEPEPEFTVTADNNGNISGGLDSSSYHPLSVELSYENGTPPYTYAFEPIEEDGLELESGSWMTIMQGANCSAKYRYYQGSDLYIFGADYQNACSGLVPTNSVGFYAYQYYYGYDACYQSYFGSSNLVYYPGLVRLKVTDSNSEEASTVLKIYCDAHGYYPGDLSFCELLSYGYVPWYSGYEEYCNETNWEG